MKGDAGASGPRGAPGQAGSEGPRGKRCVNCFFMKKIINLISNFFFRGMRGPIGLPGMKIIVENTINDYEKCLLYHIFNRTTGR